MALLWAGSSTSFQAQQPDAATLASQVCASCHGPQGNSISPAFPKLAGQQKAYLEAQLKAFRDRTRADPMAQAYMWGMTAQLGDAMITNLADYYSRQTPSAGKVADPSVAKGGQAIFEAGIAATSVPACQTCHGPQATGNGLIPRLANQHPEYLVKQLVSFKSQVRAEANAPPMHAVTSGITFAQMEAVAAYVSSLGK
jgi:cytochrome c553